MSVIIKHFILLYFGNNVKEGTTSLTQLREWLVISNLILQNILHTYVRTYILNFPNFYALAMSIEIKSISLIYVTNKTEKDMEKSIIFYACSHSENNKSPSLSTSK